MQFGPDYHVDIDGMAEGGQHDSAQNRPWIGVRFDCCGVYQRIYRSLDGGVYRGRCPKCTRQVTARVGPDGINCRFFTAE